MSTLTACVIACLLPGLACPDTADVQGRTLYVDVNSLGGPCSDDNPGTADRPWATVLKAIHEARSGDTIIFRGGAYRMPRTIHTSDFSLEPAPTAPITLRGTPGETAVITNLRPIPADQWVRQELPGGAIVYEAPASRGYRVSNVVQDGMPLKRANSGVPRRPLDDTPPEKISGSGEWTSSISQGKVWVRTGNDKPPGDSVEICDVGGFGASGNLMYLEANETGTSEGLTLICDNLTFETGFHGLLIRTGYVALNNCVLRKSFGDLLNSNSGRVKVDGCEFLAFGESAIDMTTHVEGVSGDRATTFIRNCSFHHNATPRWVGQKGYNAVMLKGRCADVVVESCRFHDLETSYGALTLGGASSGGQTGEGNRLIARNNIFRAVTGPYVVLFAAAHDCSLVNNLFTACATEDIARISLANGSDPTTQNLRPLIANNIITRNKLTGGVVNVGVDAVTDLKADCNLVFDSGDGWLFAGSPVAFGDLPARGFETHSVYAEPLFVNYEADDFRPARGSPVVDKGMDLGQMAPHDCDGTPRPKGACDIGPYEQR